MKTHRLIPPALLLPLLPALLLILAHQPAHAGSATWSLDPLTGDWNTAANWTPNTVPNGPDDEATFTVSHTTDVFVSAPTELASWTFNSDASPYFTTVNGTILVTLSGSGIANNSQVEQTIFAKADPSGVSGTVWFTGSAAVIGPISFITEGSSTANFANGGVISFGDSSRASNCKFLNQGAKLDGVFGGRLALSGTAQMIGCEVTNEPGTASTANGGLTTFEDTSSTGNAVFTSQGASVSAALGGTTHLMGLATVLDGAVFISQGATVAGGAGGLTIFDNFTNAGSATLIATGGANGGEGGLIRFVGFPKSVAPRVEVFGNGTLDVSDVLPRSAPTIIGSLEGDGIVVIGTNSGTETLSIGSNNLSTAFSGVIVEDPSVPGTGAIAKVGPSTLTLSGASTYGAGTTVRGGALLVTNTTGSATGTGTVTVRSSTLGGSGIISGPVTVGTTSGSGSFLAPAFGRNAQVTLTLENSLTLQDDAVYTYTFKANKNKARTDLVIASGVTINGASFAFQGSAQGALKQGLVLTVISNTAATPIAGTFSNLPDGAILTANGNNFQASYEGGDGNDLTLTVVP
jgi:autotransporter-associated beta strand protein